MESTNKVQFWQVDSDCAGQRVDNYLFTRLKGVPKSRIYRLLRKGEIRINKKRCKAESRLAVGDTIRIPPIRYQEKQTELSIQHFDKVSSLEQQVIFESKDTLVVNKPAGMAVHGGSGLSFGLIEGLRAIRPQAKFLELVHRLDKDTSGCLIIAKKRSALRYYQDQLRNKEMQKEYVALCQGKMKKKSQVVDAPLHKYLRPSGERYVRVDKQGKPSKTRFETLAYQSPVSLVRAWPLTGRTHQIRVHAAHLGLPLLRDEKYNTLEANSIADKIERLPKSGSFFLHARSLTFKNAADGKRITIEAGLPPAFLRALEVFALDPADISED